jgi:hypothetical protein
MARYGKTSILVDHWYHVAGVYDAASRTLDVFVDGRRDNGCLMGTVGDHQRASGRHVFVGRRSGLGGYGFIGSIDEAKVQSRALPSSEIEAEAGTGGRPGGLSVRPEPIERKEISGDAACVHQQVDPLPRVAGMLVALGVAIAWACTGLWRGAGTNLLVFALCFFTGTTVEYWSSLKMTPHPAWLAALYILMGGIAVVLAGRQGRSPPPRQ